MGFENITTAILNALPTDLVGWTQVATLAVVAVLVWQVFLFKKQLSQYERTSDIAYGPFIVPRTTIIEGRLYLAFSDIDSRIGQIFSASLYVGIIIEIWFSDIFLRLFMNSSTIF